VGITLDLRISPLNIEAEGSLDCPLLHPFQTERLFDPYFDVQFLEKPKNSITGRENDGLLAHLIKI
jgi:hypothetical protein